MAGERWSEAKETLTGLVHMAGNYQSRGVDVHFLNSKRSEQRLRSRAKVDQLFKTVSPAGDGYLAEKLKTLLNPYLKGLESARHAFDGGNPNPCLKIKPVNYIIITDGIPADNPVDIIVHAAKWLDDHNYRLNQVGLQFVQIGDEESAAKALAELDDELSNTFKIRDMVDTTRYRGKELTPEILEKMLLGGIVRGIDSKMISV